MMIVIPAYQSLQATMAKHSSIAMQVANKIRVIDILRSRGLWGSGGREVVRRHSFKSLQPMVSTSGRDDTERTKGALRMWSTSVAVQGTLGETYLQSRGLRLQLSPTLRFHNSLKHRSGDNWPALVALVTCGLADIPLAIHRTFLARGGSGKAPVVPQKMMLGPCSGGAVRLGSHDGLLMVGEGVETCLAAMQATGNPAWAALSTSGLRTLELPIDVLEVIVLADGDEPGEATARDCARRWQQEGRRVRIARPPKGLDFNDMLLGRGHLKKEGSAQ
jgi:putative DNA primase/helicase